MILCYCDNTTVVSCILKRGSSDKIRNRVTIHIFELINDLNSSISAVHLSGSENGTADGLSRKNYANKCLEWSLSEKTFHFILTNLAFRPNIDLFASHLNNKLLTYCSFKKDPFSIHVDVFTLNWGNWLPFAFPPFSLLNRLLAKLDADAVRDIAVVVPLWPTAPFFGNLLRHLKKPPIVLPPETSKLMRLPWDHEARYLIRNLNLVLTHLCTEYYAPKKCPQEWLTTLQIIHGDNLLPWS